MNIPNSWGLCTVNADSRKQRGRHILPASLLGCPPGGIYPQGDFVIRVLRMSCGLLVYSLPGHYGQCEIEEHTAQPAGCKLIEEHRASGARGQA
jgi:hypothetical protein